MKQNYFLTIKFHSIIHMNKKLKVGIAGFGTVGRKRKMFIEKHSNLELIALCDKSFSNSKPEDNLIKCYENYEDILKLPLDVLFVCLTNDIQPEVTKKALELGIHVFCEKPPGRTVQDIIDVIEVEKRHPDLKLMYGFNHRYHDSVQDAMKMIKSGSLGKIINIRGVYGKSNLITFNQPDWRTKRQIAGGGVLLDQGIHMLDLIRLFAGEFNEIKSFVSNSHWNHDVEDNAYAIMKNDKDIIAMIHSSATQWRHRFNLEINLQKGSIILGGFLSGTKSYGDETITYIYADTQKDNGDPREESVRYNKDPSWEREIDSFVSSIIENKPILNGSSNDALETMKLVYKIYSSDQSWSEKYQITK
jgi:predicted dehydrogenase